MQLRIEGGMLQRTARALSMCTPVFCPHVTSTVTASTSSAARRTAGAASASLHSDCEIASIGTNHTFKVRAYQTVRKLRDAMAHRAGLVRVHAVVLPPRDLHGDSEHIERGAPHRRRRVGELAQHEREQLVRRPRRALLHRRDFGEHGEKGGREGGVGEVAAVEAVREQGGVVHEVVAEGALREGAEARRRPDRGRFRCGGREEGVGPGEDSAVLEAGPCRCAKQGSHRLHAVVLLRSARASVRTTASSTQSVPTMELGLPSLVAGTSATHDQFSRIDARLLCDHIQSVSPICYRTRQASGIASGRRPQSNAASERPQCDLMAL